MELATINSARWAVSKALGPVTDLWAASSELGPRACALETELLCAQVMLDNARDRNVRSPALGQLLLELNHLAYSADDVLDELEYFRIQDDVEGTNETIDANSKGLVSGLVFNTRHTARAVASKLKLISCSCASGNHHTGSDEDQEDAKQTEHTMKVPKLKFDRVGVSNRMKEIQEQLKSLRIDIASTISELKHLSPNPSTTQLTRPETTPEIIEPKLYGGRDHDKMSILESIANGKYNENNLTVLSIVGPGGIGKTTFTQHIYDEVKIHFNAPIWICVSLKFSANKLTQEIVKQIPKAQDEKENDSDGERIRKRLQSKTFLLVLDDMWKYPEDEWKRLLAPFLKGGSKGNVVIITTRIPMVAKMVASKDCLIRLERLNDEECMHFFQACVFGEQKSWEGHANLKITGLEIVKKLKGSPLAVKTVGRLLRRNLDPEYWNRVLESREWQYQTNDYDIMPALRVSYNHLPFHLQHCFSYCALFPEDYEFDSKELIHFWIGLGLLIGSSDQNKTIEDMGEDNLNSLVNYGFLQKKLKEDAHPYYLIHDLLHDLAVDVSSQECLGIKGSKMISLRIPASIRHLSIFVDDAYVEDRMTFENYKSDLLKLGNGLKVEKLCSLFLFGRYHGSFLKSFGDLLKEAKALRVIFLSGASYNVEDLLHNFSRLVHLRYLRIKSNQGSRIPISISRFYHLLVLDLENCDYHIGCLREMSNLVKIRHFVNPDYEFHSGIFEVGKLKSLQGLPTFEVQKETTGFELKQLGTLPELHGSLVIRNLERVQAIGEANEARLVQIYHVSQLTLHWDTERSTKDAEKEQAVLESLRPHSSIRRICIEGHGGPTCPTWLGADLVINSLEHLCLQSVAWKSLPPLGKLSMVSEEDRDCSYHIPAQSFQNLKRLELINIPTLRKWCRNGPCHFSTCLEVVIIRDCHELVELPFPHGTSHPAEQVEKMTLFPKLQELAISNCPKLLSVPYIPWTSSLCRAKIEQVGSGFPDLSLSTEEELKFGWGDKQAQNSEHWNMVGFNNLSKLKGLRIRNSPHLPLDQMQKLASLKCLTLEGCTNLLWPAEGDRTSRYQFLPVESLEISQCNASGRELTQLFSYFPNLSQFVLWDCEMVARLGVAKKHTNKTEDRNIGQQKHHPRGEDEIEEIAQGLLLLPPQIEELSIGWCPNLSLYFCSNDDITVVGGGLRGLGSLRSLRIICCPMFLSSSSSSYSPFPDSLQSLRLYCVEGTLTLAPPSNLTRLDIHSCKLRGAGIWPLLAQGQLTVLETSGTPKLLFGTEAASRMCEQDGFRRVGLQELRTDNLTETLAMPVCAHLSSSLTKLFCDDNIECFTEEQERALKNLASLEVILFCNSKNLQSLPAGLSGLPSLKILVISNCPVIRSLPKDGLPSSLIKLHVLECKAIQLLPEGSLPSSLQILYIRSCPAIQSLPKDGLPSSLREITIQKCPAIRSLPKGCLPNSLVTLDVSGSGNDEELKRQCRKLRGTIPIVRA